jgi:DnaK suppressor protein
MSKIAPKAASASKQALVSTSETTQTTVLKSASRGVAKPANKAALGPVLTLEQLTAMPESDYMTAPQLRYFKAILDGMRADILANSEATGENLRENVVVPDPADRATIEEEHAIELRTRDRERKLLKKITQALEAIEQGEYGWCEETGDSIGLRRLLARPTATLSLEAQQRRELRQKMYGD